MRTYTAAFLLLIFCIPALAQDNTARSQSTAQPKEDAATQEQIGKGTELLNRHMYDEAIKEFKRANKLAKDKSFQAFMGLLLAYQGAGDDKAAIEAARRALALASTDVERVNAHMYAGLSLMKLGANKAERYKEAESEFRAALQSGPSAIYGHYNLGMSLLKQSRDEEGLAEMKLFVEQHPGTPGVLQAKRVIADPRRARETFMPDFSITMMDGQRISSSDLNGKVVVLDFWASWCGPCRASLPDLRVFSKHFADKPVVLISISSDRDEATWRKFVQGNNMTWLQYYDGDHKMARLFGVNAFPSYFVLDGEGIFRRKVIGAGNFEIGAVEEEVKKAVKRIEEAQKAQPGTAVGK